MGQLIAFARVGLTGGRRRASLSKPSWSGLHHNLTDGRRGMEPGDVTVLAGLAADALSCAATITV
ncbi:hypothetical protein ABT300_41390 [Streptomyces sp. NPDC001027]|uniref:hypothetical protein n=1 Tax=Streptomyces sp. NPDC001027 TaxID=3154771 RepID=UPI00331CDD9A